MLETIKNKSLYILLGITAMAFTMAAEAKSQTINVAMATTMLVEGQGKAPMGWIDFCKGHAADCDAQPTKPTKVRLTASKLAQLDAINRSVNAAVQPVTDQELYGVEEKWTYPTDKGDCEDYVLLKRRMLIDAGWPRQALLITVVRDLKGDGHAILSVVTDRGDYALDNQADEIKPWFETGYTFIKRQSQNDQNRWVLLGDGVGPVGVAAAP